MNTSMSKTIRNRYGKSLSAEGQELQNRATKFSKLKDNAAPKLNRLGDIVLVDIPRESTGNVINLCYHDSVINDPGARMEALRRLEKVLDCTFDGKDIANCVGTATEVKFKRIKATVNLKVTRQRRKTRRKAA